MPAFATSPAKASLGEGYGWQSKTAEPQDRRTAIPQYRNTARP